ncbi:MAG: beta galactosidase jelly roll domain-containing protein, partial [Candidatus Symbiothrix sp.]|nr:beta galactosidase jelly roll domain-containing protein [Candidatus Symbiothrix sp.]
MKKTNLLFFCLLLCTLVCAQSIHLPVAKFQTGDNLAWKEPAFNDSNWKELKTDYIWDTQGYSNYDGFAWYRIHFQLSPEILRDSYLKESLLFNLAKIDDADEAYLNGKLIGKTGSFPSDEGGYESKWSQQRNYLVRVDDPAVYWNKENVLAIRVYDANQSGGMFGEIPNISVIDLIDQLFLSMNIEKTGKAKTCCVTLKNTAKQAQKGKLQVQIIDLENNAVLSDVSKKVNIKASGELIQSIAYPNTNRRMKISITYRDDQTG